MDIEEIKDVYVTIKEEEKLKIEDTCKEIEDGEFKLEVNNDKNIYVEIKFNSESKKYELGNIKLNSMFTPLSKEFPSSIIKYFNKTQSFIVLPETLDTVYVKGQFYCPKMKIGTSFDSKTYELGKSFVTDDLIGSCPSEKGPDNYYEQEQRTEWAPNSLFRFISEEGKNTSVENFFNKIDIIVCDDMRIEVADIILCSIEDPWVVFIHAKATSIQSLCSASKLHEVCAQAIKNLGYLAMFNDNEPSKLGSWDDYWSGSQIPRLIKVSNSDDATQVWAKIRSIINNPVANKEVWLFTGNIISKEHFEVELGKKRPRPNVIQAAYLLHATMSEVASVGAKFRIFCNP